MVAVSRVSGYNRVFMRLLRDLDPDRETSGSAAVAIGNFDGVHLGHAALIEAVREADGTATVLSFEPLPREVFQPESPPARLTRAGEKLALLGAAGIEQVCLLRFDNALARLSPDAFAERALAGTLGARRVVVGPDFRFGHKRAGDVATLRELGRKYGFGVEVVEPVLVDGERISSTAIRTALAEGDLVRAETLLGRPYTMTGRVIPGRRLGRDLGFATANIATGRRRCPVAGIFAVRVDGAGLRTHPGVASVGVRPTVAGEGWLLEVHLFDFDGDLYRQKLTVTFVARIRDEWHFPDIASMVEQMHDDASRARLALAR